MLGSLATKAATNAAAKAKANATAAATKAATTAATATAATATSAASAAATKATNAASSAVLTTAVKGVPGGTATVGVLTGLGISSTAILASGTNMITSIKTFFTTMSPKTMALLAVSALIIGLIIWGLVSYSKSQSFSNPQNVTDKKNIQVAVAADTAATLGQTVKGTVTTTSQVKEKFANATGTPENDLKLINIQPLTVKQTGFLGPVDSGVFDEVAGVKNALKAGVRTFVLQIDYQTDPNKTEPLFPPANEPCLLYRDNTGVLTSLNAGSIKKVADALATHSFVNTLPAKDDPIVLILYALRTPDPVTAPKEYLAYCSKIAKQLAALAPFHLGLTTQGDYHRQALQGQLFTTPFKQFEKKVIILSNMDTSLFRKGIQPYAPVDDLDYWVHAQLYKLNDSDKMGVTSVASANTKTRAIVVPLESLTGLSSDSQKAWATKNKDYFSVVIPSAESNPSVSLANVLLGSMGVNVLPLDLFSFDVKEISALFDLWKKNTWNMRPVALRSK